MNIRNFVLPLLLLAVLSFAMPSGAQDDVDDARERREEIAQESAEKAAQLDVLAAEDAEIVAALAEIEAYLAIQEALLDSAQQELEAAILAQSEALDRASQLDTQIVDLESDITERSVATYVGGQQTSSALDVQNITEAAAMRFLAEDLTGITADLTDVLRLAREQQAVAVEEAREAAAAAEDLRDEVAGRVQELEATRADQQKLKEEVDARISVLETESAELAAEDQAIRDFILGEEARAEQDRLAAEEAARLAEQERAEEAARREAEAQAERDAAADADSPSQPAPAPAPTATPSPTPTIVTVDTTPDAGNGGAPSLIWPVNGPVVSGYGNRVHPVYGTYRFHAGVDIDAPAGANIWASGGGTVIFAGWRDGYGNTVIVDHGGGYTTLYAHMSAILIGQGASVGAGTLIGQVGQTGLATGDHCHFEVRINGTAVDPVPYMG